VKRRVKDKSQIRMLKHYYYLEQYPNQVKIKEIAEKIGLSYYQVYKWFWEQNRKSGVNKMG